MALPTGSGSEILKRLEGTNSDTGNTGAVVLTVAALHIVSILSITMTNTTGTQSRISISLDNGTKRYVAKLIYVDPYLTFAFNEKMVLEAGDILRLHEHSAQSIDYWVSYIEQNWS